MTAEGDSEPEATIAPLLSMTVNGADGQLLAAPQCRLLLRSLGTTAPASQLWNIALELTTEGQLGFLSEASLQRFSPLLFDFLQPHLTSRACHVLTFVDMLSHAEGELLLVMHVPARPIHAAKWLKK